MNVSPLTVHDDHALLTVRLTPNARQEGIEGVKVLGDGKPVLAVRVRAVPEDGAANAALEKLLAGQVGVAKSRVSVISGHTQRVKIVRIDGDSSAIAQKLLG